MNTKVREKRVGPGRPREFDLDEALEAAIAVFHARGYHGTSVQDLTNGTGLARGSLYKAFHDKRSLFLAALEHYTEGSLRRLAETLDAPGLVRTALRETMVAYTRRVAGGCYEGCIITMAAMEMVPQDAEVSAVIWRMYRRLQDLFAAAIIRGQLTGEIPQACDERVIARMLIVMIQGLRILGKTAPNEEEVVQVVELALRALD